MAQKRGKTAAPAQGRLRIRPGPPELPFSALFAAMQPAQKSPDLLVACRFCRQAAFFLSIICRTTCL
ncbi:MAG: hypothetical protein DU429_03250 [Candidatus Tokpelaia sp.]|nr:MAG: hypothetical protein DU430_01110 [Candidatus Tokpelaia sp.]KAA6207135.1 MAG: hypothetical protein DU429_03250 [Candidatus Tokpelaia sp.]